MYPGYPCREALDALMKRDLFQLQSGLPGIETLPGAVESNTPSLKTITWENENQQVEV